MPKSFDVVIIGAGAAGLYASYLLNKKQINNIVLEASDIIGGRIKRLQNFADFEIDLGAETLHNPNSPAFKLAQDLKIRYQPYNEYDRNYIINGHIIADSEAKEVDKIIEDVIDQNQVSEKDISIEEYLKQKGVDLNYIELLDSLIGNDYGIDNATISINAFRNEVPCWYSEAENYVINDSYAELTRRLAKDLNIKLNWTVKEIDYSNNNYIQVISKDGEIINAKKIIITASIGVLQNNPINFIPALSPIQEASIKDIGMGQGMKIILKFKKRIWPKEYKLNFSNGIVPLWWMPSEVRSENDYVVTCFIMGKKANDIREMGDSAVQKILEYFDSVYGENNATSNFLDYYIYDWLENPYSKGAYSYPTKNSKQARKALSEPIENRIYFAGEGVNTTGEHSTVNGAMQSAEAVCEMF